METIEPEREMVRKSAPLGVIALILAVVAGGLIGGRYVAISAAIGVVVVFANFAAHGWSLAWAARISLTLLFAVGVGGFVVRLGVILAVMAMLNQLDWFSPVAFAISVVPGTVILLVFEMKQLGGRTQADLWTFGSKGSVPS